MAYEYENKKNRNKYTSFLKREDAFVIIFTRIGYVILPIFIKLIFVLHLIFSCHLQSTTRSTSLVD